MTFEEFFRKKKIDLPAFGKAEPALFAEFQTHFEQMGEKSFDHTKKYWFNKLRLQYRLAPEVQEEKVVRENRLAEQTIIQALEEAPPPASVGFKSRFKPGMAKPAESAPEQKLEAPAAETEKPIESTPPATVGFKPRFKAGVTKPAEPQPEAPAPEANKPAESTPPPATVGFKPRFKAGVTKPAEPQLEAAAQDIEKPVEPTTQPPLGFKPKFRAGVTETVDPAVERNEEPKAEEPSAEEKPTEEAPAKPAYKPRFNMKNMKKDE